MDDSVYATAQIQAWIERWCTCYEQKIRLLRQFAWACAHQLSNSYFATQRIKHIAVWCGDQDNAVQGYLMALYLKQQGYCVDVYVMERDTHLKANDLKIELLAQHIQCYDNFQMRRDYDCYIDAMFGIEVSQNLDKNLQNIIHKFNSYKGFKIALDIPSGLNANTGAIMPCAVKVDMTLSCFAYKLGQFTGQAKQYVGKVINIAVLPPDEQLKADAYLASETVLLPARQATGHKGNYGHALIVGGHRNMGGAVILAAQAAYAVGAGKVTVVCHAYHHQAILTRSPNVMVMDIEELDETKINDLVASVQSISFGMGLGRDDWSKVIYERWERVLQGNMSEISVTFDADALWFLAQSPTQLKTHHNGTPHSGEAARLLNCSVQDIEQDRFKAVRALKKQYGGNWVLKGAGSLVLEQENLWICTVGNAGMATGGMGDVLSGMIAGFKAQFKAQIHLQQIVTLHGQAGDLLAQQGQRGIQAQDMFLPISEVINAV